MAGLAERRVAGKGAAKLEAVGEERSEEGTEEEEEERERERGLEEAALRTRREQSEDEEEEEEEEEEDYDDDDDDERRRRRRRRRKRERKKRNVGKARRRGEISRANSNANELLHWQITRGSHSNLRFFIRELMKQGNEERRSAALWRRGALSMEYMYIYTRC